MVRPNREVKMATPSIRRRGPAFVGLPLLVGTGLLDACMVPALARSDWPSGTYVYADLCTAAQNGTRMGQRITLRRSPLGDGLVYEAASLSAPVHAGTVALDAATKALDFVVETDGGEIRFHGTMAVESLTGTFEDEAGSRPVHLPRVLRPHAHDTCAGETTGSLVGSR